MDSSSEKSFKRKPGLQKKAASKYDFAKVKVWVEPELEHHFVLSRFLLSRMLTVTKIPSIKAVKIALQVKKFLVDNGVSDIPQSSLEAILFDTMHQHGFGSRYVDCYRLVSCFFMMRVPLVVLICGAPCSMKSTLAQALASVMNMPNVQQTELMYELVRGTHGVAAAPIWEREFESAEATLEEYKRECAVVRRAMEADMCRVFRDGKPLIIEGMHVDPCLYVPSLAAVDTKCCGDEGRGTPASAHPVEPGRTPAATDGAGVGSCHPFAETPPGQATAQQPPAGTTSSAAQLPGTAVDAQTSIGTRVEEHSEPGGGRPLLPQARLRSDDGPCSRQHGDCEGAAASTAPDGRVLCEPCASAPRPPDSSGAASISPRGADAPPLSNADAPTPHCGGASQCSLAGRDTCADASAPGRAREARKSDACAAQAPSPTAAQSALIALASRLPDSPLRRGGSILRGGSEAAVEGMAFADSSECSESHSREPSIHEFVTASAMAPSDAEQVALRLQLEHARSVVEKLAAERGPDALQHEIAYDWGKLSQAAPIVVPMIVSLDHNDASQLVLYWQRRRNSLDETGSTPDPATRQAAHSRVVSFARLLDSYLRSYEQQSVPIYHVNFGNTGDVLTAMHDHVLDRIQSCMQASLTSE